MTEHLWKFILIDFSQKPVWLGFCGLQNLDMLFWVKTSFQFNLNLINSIIDISHANFNLKTRHWGAYTKKCNWYIQINGDDENILHKSQLDTIHEKPLEIALLCKIVTYIASTLSIPIEN